MLSAIWPRCERPSCLCGNHFQSSMKRKKIRPPHLATSHWLFPIAGQLADDWLRQGVETSDRYAPEARFTALSKRLDDVSSNLSDSYKVSVDGDRFKDEQRKNTFRGLLQESLVSYAENVLALDEMCMLLANQWKIKPNIDKPFAEGGLAEISQPTVPTDTKFQSTNQSLVYPSEKKIQAEPQGVEKSVINAPKQDAIVGKWNGGSDHPNTTHEFRPDGTYIYKIPPGTATGTWSRNGNRIVFNASNADGTVAISRWLIIDSRKDDVINVRINGTRQYEWRLEK